MAVLPVALQLAHHLIPRQTVSPVQNHQFEFPQSRDIHIIALVPSTFTLISALLGIYWFCTMQRNFRLSLILMLIIADGFRGLWIFIFSVVGLVSNNHIKTQSAFCQAGGFFLQMSFEACDIAIFFLTIHVTLQILTPPWLPCCARDGLYGVRKWVVGCSVILPLIDALIPFSRYPKNTGYTFDGAYCSLFLEPLWYTLTLSWVPRYLCWLSVLICITAVYIHTSTHSFDRRSSTASQANGRDRTRPKPLALLSYLCCTGPKKRVPETNDAPSIDPEPTTGGERRGSEFSAFTVHRQNSRPQIKKLLVYPAVYILAWSVPFSAQVLSYTTSRDVNSVYPLRAGSVFCASILGFFDVVIFCWREKPWKYNSRGDGTLFGSFNIPFNVPASFSSRRPSVITSIASIDVEADPAMYEPARRHKTFNKGTDRHQRHALQAYERLALERAEALSRPPIYRTTNSRNLEFVLTRETVDIPMETDLEKFLQDKDAPIMPSDMISDEITPTKAMARPPPQLQTYQD